MARDPHDPLRLRYEAVMGTALGSLFSELWQELTWLNFMWAEYRVIFATSPEQLDVANKAAGEFFFIIQKVMWEAIVLTLARLTDPPLSLRSKANVAVTALSAMVDRRVADEVDTLTAAVFAETAFARDWRNRYIAHRDLPLALGHSTAAPLATASRDRVARSLAALAALLNSVDKFYEDTTTLFGPLDPLHGATALVRVMQKGLESIEKEQLERRRGWSV